MFRLRYKILFCLFLLASFFITPSVHAQENEKTNRVNIGIVYPLSTNGVGAAEYTNAFSLNALLGISKYEKAVALAGFANIVKDDASGLQIAGYYNYIGDHTNGVQLAGFANRSGSTEGVQVATAGNLSKKNIRGIQMAGLINKSADVTGLQLACFLNIARKVHGVQLAGLINVADSSDYPIALLNFIKNGQKSMGITVDQMATTLAVFRSGGNKTYGIFSLGYNLQKSDESFLAFEGGLGAHLYSSTKMGIDAELLAMTLENFDPGRFFRSKFQLVPKFNITPSLSIFAAPSLNYANTNFASGADLLPAALWDKIGSQITQKIYLGLSGGLQLSL